MLDKQTTIKDIAALVGVSNTTVSAVLGASTAGHVRVSAATRQRILDAAAQMRYRPNRAARALRCQTTNVIGVYAPKGRLNPYVTFTSQIIGGLHQGCDAQQKDLLLHNSYPDRSAEEIYGELADGRIDGLILYTHSKDPLTERLISSSLPVVCIVDALPGIPAVTADDAGGSRLLARYLSERGHKRLFYHGTRPYLTSAARRLEAFQGEAKRCGMDISHYSPLERHEDLRQDDVKWLDLPRDQRPTAGVCWNDLAAYRLLELCRERRISVPADFAVVGFDDIQPPHANPLRLTTIHAPWLDVARTAIELLVWRINGEEIPAETILPVTFAPGDTA